MRHKGECNEHIIPYIAKCSRPIIFANFANEAIRENFCREFHMHIIPIDPVTMVTGVLSDVSKTRKFSLVFRAGSKSFRYRVSKSRRSLQLKRTAAVITI